MRSNLDIVIIIIIILAIGFINHVNKQNNLSQIATELHQLNKNIEIEIIGSGKWPSNLPLPEWMEENE